MLQIDTSVSLGVSSIIMGMPHRGRLNVLSNVVRKSNESIFSEFTGSLDNVVEGSGDGIKPILQKKYLISFISSSEISSWYELHSTNTFRKNGPSLSSSQPVPS